MFEERDHVLQKKEDIHRRNWRMEAFWKDENSLFSLRTFFRYFYVALHSIWYCKERRKVYHVHKKIQPAWHSAAGRKTWSAPHHRSSQTERESIPMRPFRKSSIPCL